MGPRAAGFTRDFGARLPYCPALRMSPRPESGMETRFAVKKAKPLPHRNRGKSARHRAKLKAKHKRVRLRRSRGERSTYR